VKGSESTVGNKSVSPAVISWLGTNQYNDAKLKGKRERKERKCLSLGSLLYCVSLQ
jgi:hypothetical protein